MDTDQRCRSGGAVFMKRSFLLGQSISCAPALAGQEHAPNAGMPGPSDVAVGPAGMEARGGLEQHLVSAQGTGQASRQHGAQAAVKQQGTCGMGASARGFCTHLLSSMHIRRPPGCTSVLTNAPASHAPLTTTQVDRDTMDMLRAMNMGGLPGVSLAQVRTGRAAGQADRRGGGRHHADGPALGMRKAEGACWQGMLVKGTVAPVHERNTKLL